MTGFYRRQDYMPWGLIPRAQHDVARPRFADELPRLLQAAGNEKVLGIGLQRSYGDSCVNAGQRLIDMSGIDRFISVDWHRGIVRCDAGLALDTLLYHTVPKGWFVSTTPGTRYVTIGGAIANDVHGKNHHAAGSFGCHVRSLTLLRTDGAAHLLKPDDLLFRATVGGLGLTGLIREAEIQLSRIESAYLDCERIPFKGVDEFFALANESEATHEHTVAWVDCSSQGQSVGRGIFQRANWCSDGNLVPHDRHSAVAVPFTPRFGLVNRHAVKALNRLYDWIQRRGASRRRSHYADFFYPLDFIQHWNRMYGKSGFYQYQCVIPPISQRDAVRDILKTVLASGEGSMLSVLKTLGPRSSGGLISFPREGATLAMDFVNRGSETQELLGRLDSIVQDAGGRLYPAKDGRMPASLFKKGYPEWTKLADLKDTGIASSFWERVSHGG